MNVIDLFKSWGFHENNPQVKTFYLAFSDKSSINPPYAYFHIRNGCIFGEWFHDMRPQKAGQSGIFFYLERRSTMDDKEWQRRLSKEDGRFNNYWPRPGSSGDIDVHKTVLLNLLAPEITPAI